MKRPNIQEVASLAGVSTATVSHVINKTRFVSPEVQSRVLAAIEKIGYYPSSSARSLASNKSCIVGVVFSEIINPFYTSAYRGIEVELSKAGYDIILANTGEDPNKQESSLKALFSRSVDGLILAPSNRPSAMLDRLMDDKVPIVLFDRWDKDIPSVIVDNEDAAYKGVSHLIGDGHRRIGLISGRETIVTSIERKEGYFRALREHGLEIDGQLIFQGNSLQESGHEGARLLLSLEDRPSAIFCTNNLMTLGALHAIRELKLRCPEDIAFVGFDDHEWADIFSPPLTVLSQPTYEMGRRAAQMLVKMMEGESSEIKRKKQVFGAELVVRGSCSPECLGKYMQTIEEHSSGRHPSLAND